MFILCNIKKYNAFSFLLFLYSLQNKNSCNQPLASIAHHFDFLYSLKCRIMKNSCFRYILPIKICIYLNKAINVLFSLKVFEQGKTHRELLIFCDFTDFSIALLCTFMTLSSFHSKERETDFLSLVIICEA